MTQQAQPDIAPRSLPQIIGQIAGALSSDTFPTGERAALRRQDPGAPPGLPFYRFALHYLPADWEARPAPWITLVAGLALMCPAPHRYDRPAGQALAEAGFSEARLERLLQAEGDTLCTLLLRAARVLAAKKDSCNWVDFARLALATDPERLEEARLNIARSFYRHLKDKE